MSPLRSLYNGVLYKLVNPSLLCFLLQTTMMTMICASYTPGANRYAKSSSPGTPLVPLLSQKASKQRHNAFSLFASDYQVPRGPFSFIRPDVPSSLHSEAEPSIKAPKAAVEQSVDFNATKPVPRFRSALEQVSYLTNESAMKQK